MPMSSDSGQERAGWEQFAGQHPGTSPGRLLERAIKQDRPDLVLGVLEHTDIDVNMACDPGRDDSVSPLMTALRGGNPRIVALIAGHPGFDLECSLAEYDTWSWARSAPLDVLQQYLAIPGSDVNQRDGNDKTLLSEVVYDEHGIDKLRELLAKPGIELDAQQLDGTTPLYRAGLAGNVAAFELLLRHGADVNNRNNDNHWTILICAVADDRNAIAGSLLGRADTDVNAADDTGRTALHVAAQRGHAGMVELLLARPDIRVNVKNHMGWTPLAMGAFGGHIEVVRLLLARPDLEVNYVDQDRQTPLFHAVSAGHAETVRMLLGDTRTNVGITSRPARVTASEMAEALGFTEIADLIRGRRDGSDQLSPFDTYVERHVPPSPTTFIRPPRR